MRKREVYDPLFELLFEQFGVRATMAQLMAINEVSDKVNNRYEEAYRESCDVKGCTLEPTSGGAQWRETGYWRLCHKHFAMGCDGKPQPAMKKTAIRREANRGTDGVMKHKKI